MFRDLSLERDIHPHYLPLPDIEGSEQKSLYHASRRDAGKALDTGGVIGHSLPGDAHGIGTVHPSHFQVCLQFPEGVGIGCEHSPLRPLSCKHVQVQFHILGSSHEIGNLPYVPAVAGPFEEEIVIGTVLDFTVFVQDPAT